MGLRRQLLDGVYADYAEDKRFRKLREGAKQLVKGNGKCSRPLILFIGEGPGANEDKQGIPFVGRAGIIFELMLKAVGLKRRDVFVTNVVKYRPPGNRDPKSEEVSAGAEYLKREISIVNPYVVAFLGRHAFNAFFPGESLVVNLAQPKEIDGRMYVPLLHPMVASYSDGFPKNRGAVTESMEGSYRVTVNLAKKIRKERKNAGWARS